MHVVDIRSTATELPDAWNSLLLGQVGSTGVKVLRMDGRPLESESHDTAEALLVVDGTLQLVVDDVEVEVRTGEMYIVEAGVEHAVSPGSRGTLVIIAGRHRTHARPCTPAGPPAWAPGSNPEPRAAAWRCPAGGGQGSTRGGTTGPH